MCDCTAFTRGTSMQCSRCTHQPGKHTKIEEAGMTGTSDSKQRRQNQSYMYSATSRQTEKSTDIHVLGKLVGKLV